MKNGVGSGSRSIFVRGTDPGKFGPGSAPKCHGSPTLIFALLDPDPDPDPMTRLNPDPKHWLQYREGKAAYVAV
jgi:hypothetical protein